MSSRSVEIGTFDVGTADTVLYDSQPLSTTSLNIGDIEENVASVEVGTDSTIVGMKIYYELVADSEVPGRSKVIWQLSSRDHYWYPGSHNTSPYFDQMPPGIYDQAKQSAYGGGTGLPLSELERFVDPAVEGTAPSTLDSGDRIAIHARVSNDSDVFPQTLNGRVTLTVWTRSEAE